MMEIFWADFTDEKHVSDRLEYQSAIRKRSTGSVGSGSITIGSGIKIFNIFLYYSTLNKLKFYSLKMKDKQFRTFLNYSS